MPESSGVEVIPYPCERLLVCSRRVDDEVVALREERRELESVLLGGCTNNQADVGGARSDSDSDVTVRAQLGLVAENAIVRYPEFAQARVEPYPCSGAGVAIREPESRIRKIGEIPDAPLGRLRRGRDPAPGMRG